MSEKQNAGETPRDWYGRVLRDPSCTHAEVRTAKTAALEQSRKENTEILVERAKAKAAGTWKPAPPHTSRRSDAAQRHCLEREAERLGVTYEQRLEANLAGVSAIRQAAAIEEGKSLDDVIAEVAAEKEAADTAAALELERIIED